MRRHWMLAKGFDASFPLGTVPAAWGECRRKEPAAGRQCGMDDFEVLVIDAMDGTEGGWRDSDVSPLGTDGVDQGMWAVVFSWLGIRCFLERGGLGMIGSECWDDGMICKLPLLRRVTDGWQKVEGGWILGRRATVRLQCIWRNLPVRIYVSRITHTVQASPYPRVPHPCNVVSPSATPTIRKNKGARQLRS